MDARPLVLLLEVERDLRDGAAARERVPVLLLLRLLLLLEPLERLVLPCIWTS